MFLNNIYIGQNAIVAQLIIQGLLLGLGLTMDACAVSMANGLQEPKMSLKKILFIAGMFSLFQGAMPLIGYLFGNVIYENFSFVEKYHVIPILSLIILLFLGGKMVLDGIKEIKEIKNLNIENSLETVEEMDKNKEALKNLTFKVVFLQAIATSIDALSSGLTFSSFNILEALLVIALIMIVTLVMCIIALFIGKKFGDKLGPKAILIGGIVLILIGIEIFITGIWF